MIDCFLSLAQGVLFGLNFVRFCSNMDLNVNFIIFGILSTAVVLSNAAHLHESADTRTYRKAAHLRQDGVGFRQASGFGSAGFETRTFTGKNSTHTSGEVLGSIPREGAVQNNITAQATRQAETPEIDQVLASIFDSQRFAETFAKWRDVLRSVDHSIPVVFFVSSAERVRVLFRILCPATVTTRTVLCGSFLYH